MFRFSLIVAAVLASQAAYAGPTCTSEPRANWLPETAMKAKIAELGYKVRVFKVTSGNCYEIYGHDPSGKRTEVYFHPITGAVVEEHKS